MVRAYDEVIDFLAAGVTPSALIAFRPSAATRARVAELIRREKNEGLTPEEAAELDDYIQLEHLMRLAKARARAHLKDE